MFRARGGGLVTQRQGTTIAALLWLLGLGCGPTQHAVPDPDTAPPSRDEIQAEYREAARAAYARGVFLREQGIWRAPCSCTPKRCACRRRAPSCGSPMRACWPKPDTCARRRLSFTTRSRRFGGSSGEYLLQAASHSSTAMQSWRAPPADSAVQADPNLAEAWLLRRPHASR
jgi:hypothetical protein